MPAPVSQWIVVQGDWSSGVKPMGDPSEIVIGVAAESLKQRSLLVDADRLVDLDVGKQAHAGTSKGQGECSLQLML